MCGLIQSVVLSLLQELPDLEQRAAAGVEDLKSSRVNGSAGHDQRSQDDALFLQLHAAQLDVLAPTHRGACIGAETLTSKSTRHFCNKAAVLEPDIRSDDLVFLSVELYPDDLSPIDCNSCTW